MPTQPTSKVVKREGQRGARIDSKGCKVRTTKDIQGNKRQYNKRGEEKITLKTTGNEMRLVVATEIHEIPILNQSEVIQI